jgi:excisionase family DNA binding protein
MLPAIFGERARSQLPMVPATRPPTFIRTGLRMQTKQATVVRKRPHGVLDTTPSRHETAPPQEPASLRGPTASSVDELVYQLPEVAERLNCSIATVRRRIAERKLIAVRHGRILRVLESDLHAFIRASRRWR